MEGTSSGKYCRHQSHDPPMSQIVLQVFIFLLPVFFFSSYKCSKIMSLITMVVANAVNQQKACY